MGAFTAAESNNQIEAENSSHQALKRAWEQLSYRIRYDKSKTIRTESDREWKSKILKILGCKNIEKRQDSSVNLTEDGVQS